MVGLEGGRETVVVVGKEAKAGEGSDGIGEEMAEVKGVDESDSTADSGGAPRVDSLALIPTTSFVDSGSESPSSTIVGVLTSEEFEVDLVIASKVELEGNGGNFGGGDLSIPFPFFFPPLPLTSSPLMTIDSSLPADPSLTLAGEPRRAESEFPALRMLFDVYAEKRLLARRERFSDDLSAARDSACATACEPEIGGLIVSS